jgi:hypothetical protein
MRTFPASKGRVPTLTLLGHLLVALFFGGCQSPRKAEEHGLNTRAAEVPQNANPVGPFDLRLSENERLGEVAFVSLEDRQVVLRSDPDTGFPNRGMVVARSADFTPTAILELAGISEGAAVGAQILWGNPQVGEEIVAPGPDLRAWGDRVLAELDATL